MRIDFFKNTHMKEHNINKSLYNVGMIVYDLSENKIINYFKKVSDSDIKSENKDIEMSEINDDN